MTYRCKRVLVLLYNYSNTKLYLVPGTGTDYPVRLVAGR